TMPGAETFFYPGGKAGCLLTPGFTATPQEMHELGTRLASQGHTVLGVRLFGHGTRLEDMVRSRWTDWLASVEDGYHLLRGWCDQVVVMGFSTGGCLSLIMVSELPVDGIVTLSAPYQLPPIYYLKQLYPILPALSTILPSIPKGPPSWNDMEAAKSRVQYDAYPLRSAYEFGAMLEEMRPRLSKVTAPALLIHSLDDNFITPSDMQHIHDSLGSTDKRMVHVQNSNHIIPCDAAREDVFRETGSFVAEIVKRSA
ncbi:MAG: alpha/beta fold hydrolase, partial [Anaerolineales bacterium]|nr:alpha/beta fold hydrolase [Anaerolineales bacterium]